MQHGWSATSTILLAGALAMALLDLPARVTAQVPVAPPPSPRPRPIAILSMWAPYSVSRCCMPCLVPEVTKHFFADCLHLQSIICIGWICRSLPQRDLGCVCRLVRIRPPVRCASRSTCSVTSSTHNLLVRSA